VNKSFDLRNQSASKSNVNTPKRLEEGNSIKNEILNERFRHVGEATKSVLDTLGLIDEHGNPVNQPLRSQENSPAK
jgi:hypothetical protein